MARTKKQKEEENDEEYESYAKIAYWIIFVVAIFIFNRCSNSNNNDVKIIKQYECSVYDDSIHRICGIVQNNGNKNITVSINADFYNSDGVKVDTGIETIKVDAKGGKTQFQTTGTSKPYRTYKVYINRAY